MINVILVDDEKPVLDYLHKMIKELTDLHVAGTYTKPSEALAEAVSIRPHAAFLDIEMAGMSGLELAAQLTALNPEMEVVMVTAFNEYAVQAFRVNAIDYLLKPVSSEEIIRCVEKLKKRLSMQVRAAPKGEARTIGFGGFEVYSEDGTEPIRFPTAKVEELLAFMYVHRHTGASKWAICEQLWPTFEPVKAEQNLHTTVYRLRKLISEFHLPFELKQQLGNYRITGWNRCDFIEFEEYTITPYSNKSVEKQALQRALALYKGPLFAGKEYAWCESERDRLERRFCAAAKQLAVLYSAEGDDASAEEILRFLVEQSVYDEQGHEMLLRIYVRRNDKISFFFHYSKMKEKLHEELGLLPRPEIMEMFNVMLQR